MIDKDAGELAADCLGEQNCCNGGVYTARERTERTSCADLCAQFLDGLLNEGIHAPGARTFADVIDEITQNLRAVFCVHDLGMELHSIKTLTQILHRSNWTDGGACRCMEACRELADIVRVAHPADVFVRNSFKQRGRFVRDVDFCPPVFACGSSFNAPAAEMCHQLGTVADAEYGNPKRKELFRCRYGFRSIDAVRTACQNDAAWCEFSNAIQGQRMWMYLAIDVVFPHAARNELIILSTEIQYQNHFRGLGSVHHRCPFLSNLLHLP